jgi:tRNA pseudouridine13 synthase
MASLPFITQDIAPVPAQLKQEPEDFEVEEIPAYLPVGSGEHLYLFVEKRGRNTPDVVRSLCEQLGANPENAGWAGLKDRRAITRQWISIQTPQTPDAAALVSEGVRVLELSRHANKLRSGHLKGNRFKLRLGNVDPAHDARIAQVLELLRTQGMPNYFGSQRFGFDGKNITSAHAWLVEGKRAPDKPFLRKLFVSSLQGALFNAQLGERIARGLFGTALDGDVMRKEDTGGVFISADPEADGPRVARWEISATGPMFGASMRSPERAALEFEQAALTPWNIDPRCFERARKLAEGTRRPLRVRPDQVQLERQGETVSLAFDLPKGSYATGLVAEITKSHIHTLSEDP